jgi:5'-nucleotidase
MSHSGLREPKDGPITEGEDLNLAKAVPEIDVIVGGHTHTFVRTPIISNGTPVVQAGCYGQALGKLVIEMNGRERKVVSYRLHTIDDEIPGEPKLATAVGHFRADTSRIVFEPRGFKSTSRWR